MVDPPPVLAPGVSSVVVDAGCKPGCRPAVPRGKLSMVESLMLLVDMDPVGTVDGGNNIVRFGVNRELHGSWSLILAGIGWPVIILSCLSNVCLTALVLSYCCKYKNLKRKTYTRVPRRGN